MIWRCDLIPQYKAYKHEIDEAIQRVLNSGRYTLASEVTAFEEEFAKYIGVDFSVGVGCGTDGLILSLKALGISKGDEVITTPFTAIPTVSAIIAAGARPVFADVCYDTFLIDLNKIADAVTAKTKAIMPVHIFGNVVDILRLRQIVGADMPIIEDAAQAHGSKLDDRYAGALGDLGVFSFYPTKNLGGYGDGGMVVTNSKELADKLKLLRMYGMVDKDHIVINGINSRLDEIQAAILRVKIKYLGEMNQKRKRIADWYKTKLRLDLFEYQVIPENVFSNYHVFVSKFKGDRDKFIHYLEQKEIQTNIYYPFPLHLQKANDFLGIHEGALPIAEKLCYEVIALPIYPELTDDVFFTIVGHINRYNEM